MPSMQELKKAIRSDLPKMMESDPEIREFILRLTREMYAGKQETESRFDRMLEELKRDREARDRNWQDQKKQWEAQEKKWEENQKTINSILKSIQSQEKKYDSTIGALGARWGIHSEAAFRNGLKAILEDSFDVTVKRYEDYDHEGQVFGRPDQIEMDLIIHNGTLILCEIKSSMDKGGMYLFWRKKAFYEQKHGIEVSRAMVISPMIDDPGKRVAQDLGIETYSYADSVKISDDK